MNEGGTQQQRRRRQIVHPESKIARRRSRDRRLIDSAEIGTFIARETRHDRLHADSLGIDPAHARRYPRGRRGRLVPFRPRAVVVSCLERAPRALRQAQTTGICSARLAEKAESGHEINTVCCSTIMKLARLVG